MAFSGLSEVVGHYNPFSTEALAARGKHQAELRAQRESRRIYTGLQKERKAARVEEKRRYESGLADIGQIAGLFGPEYTAGMEHAALTGAKQSLIGRGLGGTTRPMTAGAGIKAHFEGLRRGKLAEALTRMAAYKQAPQQIIPSSGELTSAAGAYTNILGQQTMSRSGQTPSVVSGGGPAGGPTYMASAAARASRFMSGGVGGVSGVPMVDFSLPSGISPMAQLQPLQGPLTVQQAQYTR
jgi:hypothetical protein